MKRFIGLLDSRNQPTLHPSSKYLDCGNYAVFFRGYIANSSTLIGELRSDDGQIADNSDGELFAKAYQRWGEGLQSHVIGEYAVAIFDKYRSTLFLTHDALGLVPLFYLHTPERFFFATHLEDLVLYGGVSDFDEEYIADYLATCSVLGSRTPYIGIRRLLPGYSLRWADRKIAVLQTWTVPDTCSATLASNEDLEEQFRILLGDGVRAALRGEGKIWAELSGGLDSSTIISVAAKNGAADLEAVSIIYSSSKSADESAWIKKVLEHYPMRWNVLDGDAAKPFSVLPQGFCAEPLNVAPGAGLMRRYRALAASRGVQTVLTGMGGDEIFGGDAPRPCYLADFLPFHWLRLWRELRYWCEHSHDKRSVSYLFFEYVAGPYVRYAAHKRLGSSTMFIEPPWIDPAYLRETKLKKRNQSQIAPRCKSIGQQYLAERIWKIGLAAGDDAGQPFVFRYPLLYRPLVEFMLAIPSNQVLNPREDRHLQRRALKGILPEAIRQRCDKGGPAEAEIIGLRDGAWAEALLNCPKAVQRGYFDAHRWREAVDQARFGRIASMRHFVASATLEIWLQQSRQVKASALTLV